jgi:hypothetical protein
MINPDRLIAHGEYKIDPAQVTAGAVMRLNRGWVWRQCARKGMGRVCQDKGVAWRSIPQHVALIYDGDWLGYSRGL